MGITRPQATYVAAVLKLDHAESLFCVYNEWVASRLAALLQAPLATGALALHGATTGFASLQLIVDELPLPNVRSGQLDRACALYGSLAAGLLVFDLWIGNYDRALNLKAAVSEARRPLFCGFDHSHCLLTNGPSLSASLAQLKSRELIVSHHPFFGRVESAEVRRWLTRIESLPVALIRSACRSGERLSRVPPRIQGSLGTALVERARFLRRIMADHASVIALQ